MASQMAHSTNTTLKTISTFAFLNQEPEPTPPPTPSSLSPNPASGNPLYNENWQNPLPKTPSSNSNAVAPFSLVTTASLSETYDSHALLNMFGDWMASRHWHDVKELFEAWVRLSDKKGKPNKSDVNNIHVTDIVVVVGTDSGFRSVQNGAVVVEEELKVKDRELENVQNGAVAVVTYQDDMFLDNKDYVGGLEHASALLPPLKAFCSVEKESDSELKSYSTSLPPSTTSFFNSYDTDAKVFELKSVDRDFAFGKLVTLREKQHLCRLYDEFAENLICAISENTGSVVSIEAENYEERIVDGQGLRIRVACDGYSTASSLDCDVESRCSRENLDNGQFEKVSVALNEFQNNDMQLYGLDRNDEIMVEFTETDNVMQRKLEVVNNAKTFDMVEETSNADRLLESIIEDYIDNVMLEQNPRTCEFLSDAFVENFKNSLEYCEENIEYITTANHNVSVIGSLGVTAASRQESESEKLGGIIESVVDSKAILQDSFVGFESNGDLNGLNQELSNVVENVKIPIFASFMGENLSYVAASSLLASGASGFVTSLESFGLFDNVFFCKVFGDEADMVFRTMNVKGDNQYVKLIVNILGRESQYSIASKLFDIILVEEFLLDVRACTTVLHAYARSGKYKRAIEIFEKIKENHGVLDAVTYNELVEAYVRAGFHDEKTGLVPDLVARDILMFLSNNNLTGTIPSYFSSVKNSELYNNVIGGLGQFRVITGARISLKPAPRMVKWMRLIYNDFSAFTNDKYSWIIPGFHYEKNISHVEFLNKVSNFEVCVANNPSDNFLFMQWDLGTIALFSY